MFEQAFKNIDDVLRKEAGCTTELDYTEQTSWLLFLKYLDGLEQDRADEAALEGKKYSYILAQQYRWESWAAPKDAAGKLDQCRAQLRRVLHAAPAQLTMDNGQLTAEKTGKSRVNNGRIFNYPLSILHYSFPSP